jgi:hypothetical protein
MAERCDESLLTQTMQRASHRCAADAESLGNDALSEWGARRQLAPHDPLTQSLKCGCRSAYRPTGRPSCSTCSATCIRCRLRAVWPIVERPIPQSDIPGERTAATQPFPAKPAPYARQGFSLDDVVDFTPEIKAAALAEIAQYRIGPMYARHEVADPTRRLARR